MEPDFEVLSAYVVSGVTIYLTNSFEEFYFSIVCLRSTMHTY